MRNAPIVQGVPTQYVYQNRVYPTRFHGGSWVRPVFGFPKKTAPFDVFTQSYNVDRSMPQPTLSGLGATVGTGPLWNTGEGVFRPGGYGGGVFDGNISGLGSIGARPTPKALGEDADAMPWKTRADRTLELQSTINAYLLSMGMCPIGVDGKLGGATCGAAKYVLDQKGGSAAVSAEMPSACNAHQAEWSAPKKNTGQCGASAAPVSVTPASTLPSPALQSGMSSSSKRALGFALGGALAIGAVVLLKKRR